MLRIQLQSDPYQLELYCPFCGKHVVGSSGEGFVDECKHMVSAGPDGDMEDVQETDIVFSAFESAPANRDHEFVFREPT